MNSKCIVYDANRAEQTAPLPFEAIFVFHFALNLHTCAQRVCVSIIPKHMSISRSNVIRTSDMRIHGQCAQLTLIHLLLARSIRLRLSLVENLVDVMNH